MLNLVPSKFSYHLSCLLLLLLPVLAMGQTKTSNGIGNWQDINWTPAGQPSDTDNVSIKNDSVTIPEGTTVKVNDLEIGDGGNLIVNGNLIVQGNLNMTNNSEGFSMGPSSTVVVFGDLTVNNKVELSFSSYLIIYGNFENKGSSNQGSFDIENASIYVFGDVTGNGFPASFGCTEDYSGTTGDGSETCDYGNETDYENNQENIPPAIIDLLNCYDLTAIEDAESCPGQNVTYSVALYNNVKYQWQEKKPADNTWTNVGNDAPQFTISNVTIGMSGNLYRVVVTPTETNATCKISISRNVSLTVSTTNIWTGAIDTNWNNTSNWNCGFIPDLTTEILIPDGLTDYPILNTGAPAQVKDITLEGIATLEILSNDLQIAGTISSNGNIDATAGTIILQGSTLQDIPAGSFLNDKIGDLTINNPAGAVLSGPLGISGILLLQSGNLTTNSNLSLLSDIDQTALIDGSGNGEIVGLVTMQRYLDSAFGYKYFSTPFSNTLVGDYSAYVDLSSTFPHFYSYDEARESSTNADASGWTAYDTASDALNILEGYALNFGSSSAAVTVELTGEVNNGSYSRTLQNSDGTFTKGYNLVGNPYPSPIDWNAASGWTKQNIDDAVYFFTASDTDEYAGTYTSFVGGISSGSGSGGAIIPSMQGFFVKVSDGFTTGNLGLTNEVRSTDLNQDFYKQQEEEKSSENQKAVIRLKAGFKDSPGLDAAVIYFSPIAKPEFEKDKDALKLMNTDVNVPNVYSLNSEGKKLSINGTSFQPENGLTRIPLGIEIHRDGQMNIQLAETENLNSEFIYLIDKQNRTGQDLRKNTAFKIYLKKGTYNSRFELLLSNTPISDPAIAFMDPFSVINQNGQVMLNHHLKDQQKGLVQVFNLNGQTLDLRNLQGDGNIEIKGIKSSGLYLFILSIGKERYTKKVLIKL